MFLQILFAGVIQFLSLSQASFQITSPHIVHKLDYNYYLQCRLDIGILVFVSWVNLCSFCSNFKWLVGNHHLNYCIGREIFSPCMVDCSLQFNYCFLISFPYRVQNAEVLCLGMVSVAVFMLVMPLFKVTGGILLQMAPPSIPSSALSKCWRQVILFFSFLFGSLSFCQTNSFLFIS